MGTQFRIKDQPGILYEVDDYGGALVGTGTIDLYKPTFSAMNRLGSPPCRYRSGQVGFVCQESEGFEATHEMVSHSPDDCFDSEEGRDGGIPSYGTLDGARHEGELRRSSIVLGPDWRDSRNYFFKNAAVFGNGPIVSESPARALAMRSCTRVSESFSA